MSDSPFAQFARKPRNDARDEEILLARYTAYMALAEPSIGDWVRFRDGVGRRIGHVWWDGAIQTSRNGSFYLGEGYVSFSGELYRSIPSSTLTLSKDRQVGSFWFFHHDRQEASNGVTFNVECRIWDCSEDAPS